MYLGELKIGQRARVKEIEIENREIKRHLLDMGLTRGVEVEILKKAPMGDPIDIKIRDYELCISKENLSRIKVEVIK